MSKPRVAFFDFTCCEGCQLQVLSLEDELVNLLGLIDIVNFREASSAFSDDYDLAFVEGSISRESEIPRLEKIREQAKTVVALGACACLGGVNCLKNCQQMGQVRELVYGEQAEWVDTIPARPIWSVVTVDYQIPGCPIDKQEFLRVVQALLTGREPRLPDYPVCVECRSKENVCVFEKGMTCLGPVTRAGCGAICPSFGNYCLGCRGLVSQPNLTSEKELLGEYGLSLGDILKAFNLFDGYYFDDGQGNQNCMS